MPHVRTSTNGKLKRPLTVDMWESQGKDLGHPRKYNSGVNVIRWSPVIEVAAVTYTDGDHCSFLELSGGNVLSWSYT